MYTPGSLYGTKLYGWLGAGRVGNNLLQRLSQRPVVVVRVCTVRCWYVTTLQNVLVTTILQTWGRARWFDSHKGSNRQGYDKARIFKLRPHERNFLVNSSLTKKNCPCGWVNLVKLIRSNQPGWKLGCTVFQPATCSPSNENSLVWTASKENLPKICARIQFSLSICFLSLQKFTRIYPKALLAPDGSTPQQGKIGGVYTRASLAQPVNKFSLSRKTCSCGRSLTIHGFSFWDLTISNQEVILSLDIRPGCQTSADQMRMEVSECGRIMFFYNNYEANLFFDRTPFLSKP